MPRYIDADALIKRIFPCDVVDKKCYTINAKAIYEEIQKAPIADVVSMAEVEQLKHKYDLAVAEREANVKGFTAEIAELQSEIKVLKDSNINLQELYQTEREKVAKAKQKVIDIGGALQSARAEIERYQASAQTVEPLLKELKGDIRDLATLARTEAIKEFAERLKEIAGHCSFSCYRVDRKDIDNLVKEMTEEHK